ncbi:MAG: hypothetical protein ACREMX_07100 [Gemmatimonadales bacterium]
MEPIYMNENRYSFQVASWRPPTSIDYEVETPESTFEMRIQELFMEGQSYLQREEFMLALRAFRELMALILHTADPKMPLDPNRFPMLRFPVDTVLVDALARKTAEILQKTPVDGYRLPTSIVSEQSILPALVQEQLKPYLDDGLRITSHHNVVNESLEAALAAVEDSNYPLAAKHYAIALDKTPDTDRVLRASLMHDMAILLEKANNKDRAQEFGQRSAELFGAADLPEGHVQALDTLTGILRRAGKNDLADAQAKKAAELRHNFNLNQVVGRRFETLSSGGVARLGAFPSSGTAPSPSAISAPIDRHLLTVSTMFVARPQVIGLGDGESTAAAPLLMTTKYVRPSAPSKSLTIRGLTTAATLALDANAAGNVKAFLQTIADTQDLGLVTGFWVSPIQMTAYLPHMYFFIVPMAIGDCLAGMGNLAQAEEQYRTILPYPFINKRYEIVKLWTRLAQVYLDLGDQAYRRAKDDTAAFGEARKSYENVVLLDRTLAPNSPLYQDAKFASVKTRITTFLAAADPLAVNENPALTGLVLEALTRIQQIQAGLNFFGFAPTYLPPFSFEYLQNTARYFAQQASQIEQRYIQFKSTAENEELRREQLDQQAEVARQSVILEQRGVAEAQAGINVAQASVNYAEVQRQNAVEARNDFNAVRWELLELAMLEAWGNAASVGEDDEIKFDIDWTYYQASDRNRSDVLLDLAGQRTRISHDLEAAKLQRAIDSAVAYKGIAQAQLAQAQARRAIAEQRVVIAQLQQRYAAENRDFLDMREFSSRLWYELAAQARRLSRRYLDMATEVAFLMERAYNAETERGLSVVGYDYTRSAAANLMGADFLVQDIDYFTLDHVTTVKAKKMPVKKVISVADAFPMAFQLLRTTGRCFFQTELAQFDSENPGMYLCKMRHLELLFVGLTGATTLAGSLRNLGVSKFRLEDGTVATRLYPQDVLPLSQYSIRQDALAFRFNPNDLRLFENNGIDTLWELNLPIDRNTFDFNELLDVQLVLYYDGFFSPTLEANIKAALPASGAASRGFSMRMYFPDELFYLKSQGDAELAFDAGMFPRNQTKLVRTDVTLKVSGEAATVGGLTLRLGSAAHGPELPLTTDADGEVNDTTAGQPLRALRNDALLDRWTVSITAADNPQLVTDGTLDLGGIRDLLVFFEYTFDYRSQA